MNLLSRWRARRKMRWAVRRVNQLKIRTSEIGEQVILRALMSPESAAAAARMERFMLAMDRELRGEPTHSGSLDG